MEWVGAGSQALGVAASKRMHHLWPALLVPREGCGPSQRVTPISELIQSAPDPKVPLLKRYPSLV